MGYFPFFVDLTGKGCLIVGGGAVALRKAEALLPFGPRITVVAPEVCFGLKSLAGIAVKEEAFTENHLHLADFVVAAATKEVNSAVSALCRERNIPVNAVDDRDNCTFLFPAFVQRGKLTVGISTAGASPTAAAYLRQEIESIIPDSFEEILEQLDALRPFLKDAIPSEAQRKEAYYRLLTTAIDEERALTPEEITNLLEDL